MHVRLIRLYKRKQQTERSICNFSVCVCDRTPRSVEILLMRIISTSVYVFISNTHPQHDAALLLMGTDSIDRH